MAQNELTPTLTPFIHVYGVQTHLTVDSFLAIHRHTTYRSGRAREDRRIWDLSQFKCRFGIWEQEKKRGGLVETWGSIIKQK